MDGEEHRGFPAERLHETWIPRLVFIFFVLFALVIGLALVADATRAFALAVQLGAVAGPVVSRSPVR